MASLITPRPYHDKDSGTIILSVTGIFGVGVTKALLLSTVVILRKHLLILKKREP